MKAKHSTVVLIPAKNEEATVAHVVSGAMREIDCDVVVIDDLSADSTVAAARSAGATVLPLPFHLGAWRAMQTGLRYALKQGYETAVTMDADGQHPASSIHTLIEPIQSSQADVVIGACTRRGSVARRAAWSFFKGMSGITIGDLTSGFRAYNRSSMSVLTSRQATLLDYQDMGVLIMLRGAGLKIVERQVEMCPRINGCSRIFSSWWVVGKYMLCNSILCAAKRLQG